MMMMYMIVSLYLVVGVHYRLCDLYSNVVVVDSRIAPFIYLFIKSRLVTLKVKKMSKIREFTILDKIGEGSFSSVYKVSKDGDKRYYALKIVKIMKLKDKDKDNTLNEIRLLASLDDDHVIGYKDAFMDDDSSSIWYVFV